MKSSVLKNVLIMLVILLLCFGASLVLQHIFADNALSSAIFVLGVFLISVKTTSYAYGIISALLSVLAVNFAFTFPFFAFDFTLSENIVSTAILLVVTMITCELTTKVKKQEMIKAESEKERMRANLLRGISHDLRTPLTTIYGASTALTENYDSFSDTQRKTMLKSIGEEAQWLSHMVENLLSITKFDAGNVRLIRTPTALDELIDSVLVKFKKRYAEQKVTVEMPEDFILVSMDALLIEQVLLNILENAVQHAVGMTELQLRVRTVGSKAVFEIRDNGCGIAKEKLVHIFSGTYSAENIPSDGQKRNAGIGLSLCASIVKAHGSEIKAENLKEGGCAFRFALDMEEESDA